MLTILTLVAAYLLGSVSTAVMVSRILELPDPREHGSGNPGATNVLRLGGRKAAVITLVGDLLKGLIPVMGAHLLGLAPLATALAGLAALLGHVFPVFLGFRGGKGVATALGVLLGLSWLAGVMAALTWLAVARITRLSSLAALVAAVLTPIYAWIAQARGAEIFILCVVSIVVILRHHENIKRLRSGEEGRIGT